jgi:hypothetical protein
MTRIQALANLAQKMGLSPVDAVALPTVVMVAAGKVRMSETDMISEALHNAPLRDYLAGVCTTAAKAAL